MQPSAIRVLVADDEANFRKLLSENGASGHRTLPAEDGVKALEILQQREVDVVLSILRCLAWVESR
jgi:CheY-like chemotaxis protein